jgi:hypothetical protein
MVGGLRAPPEEAEAAAAVAVKGGVYFVLEGAKLQVGKVGKVYPHSCRPPTRLLHNATPPWYMPINGQHQKSGERLAANVLTAHVASVGVPAAEQRRARAVPAAQGRGPGALQARHLPPGPPCHPRQPAEQSGPRQGAATAQCMRCCACQSAKRSGDAEPAGAQQT